MTEMLSLKHYQAVKLELDTLSSLLIRTVVLVATTKSDIKCKYSLLSMMVPVHSLSQMVKAYSRIRKAASKISSNWL